MDDITLRKEDFSREALSYLDALYGFAVTLTRDGAEAEDLVQETYLRAIRAYAQFVPDTNLKGWLFTIMRNIWLNHFRRTKSGPYLVDIDPDETAEGVRMDRSATFAVDPHVALVKKTEREGLRSAIQLLPSQYREVVVLRDIEGFSYRQIATILDCPAGTVMSRLARARGELRAMLNQAEFAALHPKTDTA